MTPYYVPKTGFDTFRSGLFVLLVEDDWSAASLARILDSARMGLARHVLCGSHVGLATGQASGLNKLLEKGDMIDNCGFYLIFVISEL